MALTYRLTKGSELTYAELDGNFTHLDSKIDSASLDNISSFSDVDDRLDSIALNYMTAARLPAYFQNGHAGNLLPSVDSSYDLGSAGKTWLNAHIFGTIYLYDTNEQIYSDGSAIRFAVNSVLQMYINSTGLYTDFIDVSENLRIPTYSSADPSSLANGDIWLRT